MMGIRWRVVGSIFILVGWLVFVLIHAAFWARGFDPFQNIVIVLVSFLIAGGFLGAMWAAWGMRFLR